MSVSAEWSEDKPLEAYTDLLQVVMTSESKLSQVQVRRRDLALFGSVSPVQEII